MAKTIYFSSFFLLGFFSFLAGFLHEFKYAETFKILSFILFLISTILRFHIYKKLSLIKRALLFILLYSLGIISRPVTSYEKESLYNYVRYQMYHKMLAKYYKTYDFSRLYIHYIREYLNETTLNQFYKNGNNKISQLNREIDTTILLPNAYENKPIVFINISGDIEASLKNKINLILTEKIQKTNTILATDDEFKINNLKKNSEQYLADFTIIVEIEASTIDSGFRVRSFLQESKNTGKVISLIYFFANNEDDLIRLSKLLSNSLIQDRLN